MIGCITQAGIDASNKTAGPPGAEHHDEQGALDPRPLATLSQHGTGQMAQGALNESIASTPVVQQLGFSGASGGANVAQLGPRRPSGTPGQPADHTAPSGYGQSFRLNTSREHTAALYMPGPGGA